jgi:hypothetical protein
MVGSYRKRKKERGKKVKDEKWGEKKRAANEMERYKKGRTHI